MTPKSASISNNSNRCAKQSVEGRGRSCNAISSLVATAILGLLWPNISLHAQSIQVLDFDFRDHDLWRPLRKDCGRPFAPPLLGFDNGLTVRQTEIEGMDRAEGHILNATPRPFATLMETCKGGRYGESSFLSSQQREESNALQREKDQKIDRNGSESLSTISQDINTSPSNRGYYFKNKLEFTLEGGWLPVNVPFPFDFLLGDAYNFPGLYYTLVPIMASVRWQVNDVAGPWILRGNWDVTAGVSATWIPRGPETRYFSYIMGIRRNFVPTRSRVAPYFDGSVGMGNIDAKGPFGVAAAQGQDFTFTLNLGSGVRYNFSSRYALEAGMHYMHISNLYLSEPKFLNYGINVYGPWIGINIRFAKKPRTES